MSTANAIDGTKYYETMLGRMLKVANLSIKPSYQPMEVQRIFDISNTTFQKLCDDWEPPHIKGGSSTGLESYRIKGAHRRVPYHALIDYLERSSSYEADNKGDEK